MQDFPIPPLPTKWQQLRPWLKANWLALVAIVISAFALYANWRQADATDRQAKIALEALTTQIKDAEKAAEGAERFAWESFIVLLYIEENSKALTDTTDKGGKPSLPIVFGVAFEQVFDHYLRKANERGEDGKPLPVEHKKEEHVKKILLSLIQSGAIFQTHTKRYGVTLSEMQFGFGRVHSTEQAAFHALNHVTNQPEHSVEISLLRTELMNKFNVSVDEATYAIMYMVKDNFLFIDTGGIVRLSGRGRVH